MKLDLYKQAVRLIKIAEKKKRSPQLSFYSDSGNSGVAMIRDAQHCYDLQDEIDQYGPKDGGGVVGRNTPKWGDS